MGQSERGDDPVPGLDLRRGQLHRARQQRGRTLPRPRERRTPSRRDSHRDHLLDRLGVDRLQVTLLTKCAFRLRLSVL